MIPQSVIVPSADGKHEFTLAAQRLESGEIDLDGSITSELLPITAVFPLCICRQSAALQYNAEGVASQCRSRDCTL